MTIDQALARLGSELPDEEFSERVRKIAAVELEPREKPASAISALLIPAMISAAAVVCTVDTVEVAEMVFSDPRDG